MKTIQCRVPDTIFEALEDRVMKEGVSTDHVVTMALSESLSQPLHTLFQISTASALVEGLYQGAVRVSQLLQHGNFGLGTFVDLDGEMVVLDGVCYRVAPSGAVSRVDPNVLVPYATVTQFTPDLAKRAFSFSDFSEFTNACDELRSSNNIFCAFRARGKFGLVKTRVMHPVPEGVRLAEASTGQEEFSLVQVEGSLVGIWAPLFAGSFSVPGYHFHFLSNDGESGGHVLDCRSGEVDIECCSISEMHVALPETEAFLRADLSRDPRADLEISERIHPPSDNKK